MPDLVLVDDDDDFREVLSADLVDRGFLVSCFSDEDWMRGPPELAGKMMKPYGGAIDIWEVRSEVGNVRNNKPELLDRVALI